MSSLNARNGTAKEKRFICTKRSFEQAVSWKNWEREREKVMMFFKYKVMKKKKERDKERVRKKERERV